MFLRSRFFVAALLATLALPAAAQRTDVVEEAESAEGSSRWRGSSISYGQIATTVSLDKSADLGWNPYYAHAVTLAPRYHLADDFVAGLSFTVEQELTDSDWTTQRHQPLASDLFVDLGWSGWTEDTTKIRVSGALRAALPVSSLSQAQTQIVALAPTLRVARTFDVLHGLDVSWSTRWTQHFHEQTTARTDASGIVGCTTERCDTLTNTGLLNAYGDLLLGPSVSLRLTDTLSLDGDFRWGQSFLYDNASVSDPFSGEVLLAPNDFAGRFSTLFSIGTSWAPIDVLNVTAFASTPSPQLGLDGQRRSPFFNRFTQVGFDLQLNLDALVARL